MAKSAVIQPTAITAFLRSSSAVTPISAALYSSTLSGVIHSPPSSSSSSSSSVKGIAAASAETGADSAEISSETGASSIIGASSTMNASSTIEASSIGAEASMFSSILISIFSTASANSSTGALDFLISFLGVTLYFLAGALF